MDWSEVKDYASYAYDVTATWCFTHQVETDVIIGAAVFGSIAYILRSKAMARRRLHRILWGVRMKRSKNREAFERGLISFGICDAIEDAVHRGEMSRERAAHWYDSFANDYGMTELLPQHNTETIKAAIKGRLSRGMYHKPSVIPGGKPEVVVDKTYVPSFVTRVKCALNFSRYATKA